MSEVKRFKFVEDTYNEHGLGYMEESESGDLVGYPELAALLEELADMQHWRDLALQFDNHRMSALWHLKTLAVNPSYAPAVSEFLASPPLPASEIVQRLTAAEQRNAILTEGLKEIITRCNAGWSCHAIELTAEEALEDALKPTESGASE